MNYPPAIDSIMSGLAIHTMSYLMLDQKAAQQIRTASEQTVAATVQSLSRLYEQSMKLRAEPA